MRKKETLLDIVGSKAVRALKERGAVLKIWRNSSPHNWWVESKRGLMLWHSSDGIGRKLPNLKNFNKLDDSTERVVQYWGSDSKSPCLSIFLLKKAD